MKETCGYSLAKNTDNINDYNEPISDPSSKVCCADIFKCLFCGLCYKKKDEVVSAPNKELDDVNQNSGNESVVKKKQIFHADVFTCSEATELLTAVNEDFQVTTQTVNTCSEENLTFVHKSNPDLRRFHYRDSTSSSNRVKSDCIKHHASTDNNRIPKLQTVSLNSLKQVDQALEFPKPIVKEVIVPPINRVLPLESKAATPVFRKLQIGDICVVDDKQEICDTKLTSDSTTEMTADLSSRNYYYLVTEVSGTTVDL